MSVKLGDKVRDKISGFTGIALGRYEYLFGCVRVGVMSSEMHEGKPIEVGFDEDSLEVIEHGVIQPVQWSQVDVPGLRKTVSAEEQTAIRPTTGGPRSVPAAKLIPKR